MAHWVKMPSNDWVNLDLASFLAITGGAPNIWVQATFETFSTSATLPISGPWKTEAEAQAALRKLIS